MDMLNDRTRKTTEIYTILDWVKNNMSQTYKQNSNELSKARREILQQMKQAGVDISLFEDNSFSSILSGTSLNSQGLKMKKVLTYLKELGNEQTSSNPLSRLRQQLNLDDDLPF
jgi:3-oxoacyl-[acyl-carrier-protein] synthase III